MEVSLSRSRVLLGCLSVVISVFSSEVSLPVVVRVLVNHSAESLLGTVNGSVLKREVSNVVLIDHAEYGFLLNEVILRVLEVLVFSTFEFSKSIVTDETASVLLRLAVVAGKRGWDAS